MISSTDFARSGQWPPGTVVALSGWRITALCALAIAIAAVPVFTNRFLSINDYLNHLARTAVLLDYHADPGFARFYLLHWRPLPNLAFDLWMVAWGRLLAPAFAGKLFVVGVFALLLGGTICLHRTAFKKWSLWPFLSVLLFYNRFLLVGLVNFLFGLGLWLLALALWISLRHRPLGLRAAALTAGALVVFFAHLAAFAILSVTLAVYELCEVAAADRPLAAKARELAAAALAFVPAILVQLLLAPHRAASFVIRYRDLWSRLEAFAVPILYDVKLETAVVALLLVVVLWLLATGVLRVNRPLLAGALALFALQFAMPNVILTAEGADHRLPLAMMLLAIAATDAPDASRAQRVALAITVISLFALRVGEIEQRWRRDQPAYAEAWRELSQIPAGARVASAYPPDAFDRFSTPEIALYYMPVWAIVPKAGFTQTLFAAPTQQPLVLTPRYAALAAATSANGLWRAFVATDEEAPCSPAPVSVPVLDDYDYIVFVSRAAFRVCPSPLLRPELAARHVQIFRVVHRF